MSRLHHLNDGCFLARERDEQALIDSKTPTVPRTAQQQANLDEARRLENLAYAYTDWYRSRHGRLPNSLPSRADLDAWGAARV